MRTFIVAGLVGLFIMGCSGKQDMVKKGELEQTIEQDMVQKKFIEGIGICGADKALETQTQRRADSRDCAITKAQGELAAFINGIELEGGTRVDRAITTDSILQSKLDSAIKRAEIIKTEWMDDDGCAVSMRLDKKMLQKTMGVKFK